MSEREEFTRPSKTLKERNCNVELTPVIENKFAELEEESDDEVIFKGSESGKKTNFKAASTQVAGIPDEKATQAKPTDKPNINKGTLKNAESKN